MHLRDPEQWRAPAPSGWQARLALRFERRDAGTLLAARSHEGPLAVQKALHPEGPGVCHAVVLHPPGGVAGGDSLAIDVAAGPGAHALMTTPGAGKWYRSRGSAAAQTVRIDAGPGAVVEWLPQETILFDGARASLAFDATLAEGAVLFAAEILCLGRTAAGERFTEGSLRLAQRIEIGGRPAWMERGRIDGGSGLLESPVGLAGFPVAAAVVLAGAAIDRERVADCRAIETFGGRCGFTVLPGVLVARWLGGGAEAARSWVLALWRVLRPCYAGREAVVLRIWNT